MKIGLWSDCHNFPSLPLMKISAYHKSKKHNVELYNPNQKYDVVYASKVFSFTEDIDISGEVQTNKVIKGGTGYCIKVEDNKEVFCSSHNDSLPANIEHIYPDYTIFPEYKYALGFLTRGCPRNCPFCIVSQKEGYCSHQVAELSEFWQGQKEIKLLDPNILACPNSDKLLIQLAGTKAKIDITQGLDIRLINRDNITIINQINMRTVHFAWDNPNTDLSSLFELFAKNSVIQNERNRIVYVLTNFNSTLEQDLYRIYKLRELGFMPYVMVYQKQTASKKIRRLQRWCNNRMIYWSVPNFNDYT